MIQSSSHLLQHYFSPVTYFCFTTFYFEQYLVQGVLQFFFAQVQIFTCWQGRIKRVRKFFWCRHNQETKCCYTLGPDKTEFFLFWSQVFLKKLSWFYFSMHFVKNNVSVEFLFWWDFATLFEPKTAIIARDCKSFQIRSWSFWWKYIFCTTTNDDTSF